jgi:hypothetical protein
MNKTEAVHTTKISGPYGTTTVQCELTSVPHLVITREFKKFRPDLQQVEFGDGYCVTHDITGYRIGPDGKELTREQAFKFAEEIGKLDFPWDKIRSAISWDKAREGKSAALWKAWWAAQGTKVEPDSLCCARHVPVYRGARADGWIVDCPECKKRWSWTVTLEGCYWTEVV